MLGVGYESSRGRYLLERMPLRTARRAANVGGRPGVVHVEQCVIWWLSRYLVVRLMKRCAGVRVRWWRLDTVCWFMLGYVAFSAHVHAAGEDKCKMRRSCVLNTAFGLSGGALCIEWGMEGSLMGVI